MNELGLVQLRCSAHLQDNLILRELCQKHNVCAQLELEMVERGRPRNFLTDETVEAYVKAP